MGRFPKSRTAQYLHAVSCTLPPGMHLHAVCDASCVQDLAGVKHILDVLVRPGRHFCKVGMQPGGIPDIR